MISWAYEQFQRWFLKTGDKKVRLSGAAKGKHEIKMLIRHVIAFLIGIGLLSIMALYIGPQTDTSSLFQVMKIWGIVLTIDTIISILYVIFPSQK